MKNSSQDNNYKTNNNQDDKQNNNQENNNKDRLIRTERGPAPEAPALSIFETVFAGWAFLMRCLPSSYLCLSYFVPKIRSPASPRPGRCRRSHSGSGPDVPRKSARPGGPCAGAPTLPGRR